MNQKELTMTFMMISNGKNLFGCDVFLQINSALQGLMRLIFLYKPRRQSVIFNLKSFEYLCYESYSH